MASNQTQSKALSYLAVISAAASIVVHSILANKHYQLKYGAPTSGGLCNINDFFSCDAASSSAFSELFGIPMAVLGVTTNAVLFLILLLFTFTAYAPNSTKEGVKFFALFTAIVSIFMGAVSLLVVNTLCPYCLITYILSFVTFACVYKVFGLPDFSFLSPTKSKFIPACFVAILAFSFMGHTSIKNSMVDPKEAEYEDLKMNAWKNGATKNLKLVSPIELNPESTKMHIVEFADFLCPHCKHAFPKLHAFAKAKGARLSFQAFPLDGECNKYIDIAFGSRCLLAKISQCCGTKLGAGFSCQKWIFDNQSELTSKDIINSRMDELIAEVKVDKKELQACIDSEETMEQIKAQVELAKRVGVQGTPAIFVNGKAIKGGVTVPLLERIYKSL